MLLSGSNGTCVMYLYGRFSTKNNTIICRTIAVGSQVYFDDNNPIRTLQFSWHPYSDTHLGILSSDSVFSVYKLESIWQIYNDAHTFGLKSSNSTAVSNSSLAIAWLEATFPELAHQQAEDNLLVLRAHSYVMFDSSLSLQGPLHKVHCDEEDEDFPDAKFEGRAVGLLYNSISKDSVLVTAWSSGQLQIDALADEIQPMWNVGRPSRLSFDSHDQVNGFAMICESKPDESSVVKFDEPLDHTVWLGHPPPLLSLVIVDLALPKSGDDEHLLSMFADPLIPERIYCMHGGGIDSIVLHYLPFTSQTSGKNETMRTPSVDPVLSTCHCKTLSQSPLFGFVALADSFGYSWIVGVASSRECVVLEMKSWNALMPLQLDEAKKLLTSEELPEMVTPDIISKELLSGPRKLFLLLRPHQMNVLLLLIQLRDDQLFINISSSFMKIMWNMHVRSGLSSSITRHLKRIIDEQNSRLHEAHQKLMNVEEKQLSLDDRIDRVTQMHKLLEDRLQSLRNLPGAHKRPLSRAEREFKAELDKFTGMELDALQSTIETLHTRSRKLLKSSQGNTLKRQITGRRKNQIPDSAISELSLVNNENSQKVKSL